MTDKKFENSHIPLSYQYKTTKMHAHTHTWAHTHAHTHTHTCIHSVPIITICHEFITILVSPLPSIMSIQSSIGRLDNLIIIHAAKIQK